MSGVRVRDKEMLSLGMTLPGFVERSKTIASLPSLSLLTLAAHTPEHWDTSYLEIDELTDVESIIDLHYDLIAISALTARIDDAYALAGTLRAHGQIVVLGGLHVSVLPLEASRHADAVVVGEGEPVWPILLEDLEGGRLKKLYRAREVHGNYRLRDSRTPRYDLLDIGRYNRITLQTTRGCPIGCSFCAASRLISPYKTKPIGKIRTELEEIMSLWQKPFIELADDNTFFDKRWGRQLAKLFSEYRLRWFTETDISIADDEELLESLARGGCAQLLIGLESSAPASLEGLDSKNWKFRQFETYLRKIEKIQSYGISVNGCLILGFDSDDCSVFESTYEFVSASKLSEVQITLLTPFPGTPLYESLDRSGRLIEKTFWDRCTLFDTTFHPKLMTVDELASGFRWLMQKLYAQKEYQKRRDKFRECVRVGRKVRDDMRCC